MFDMHSFLEGMLHIKKNNNSIGSKFFPWTSVFRNFVFVFHDSYGRQLLKLLQQI